MNSATIAVVGLRYAGPPLAVAFGKRLKILGVALSEEKVAADGRHVDPSGKVSTDDLRAAAHLSRRTDPSVVRHADFVVVAMPMPVDATHQPDLTPLTRSSEVVGASLKRGATVASESTVYAGANEAARIPILEQRSGMTWKKSYFVGYSPERINSDDKERALTTIVKVVSCDASETH